MPTLPTVLTLLALAGVACAADPDLKPNPVIEKAMSAACADAEKGYDTYLVVLAKATDRAVKDLEKAKQEAMKKGALATANELDAKIKELKEGGLEKAIVERRTSGGSLSGEGNVPKTAIAGKWSVKYSNGVAATIEITASGKNITVLRMGGYGSGTYICTFNEKSKAYIGSGFDGAKVEHYFMKSDKLSMVHITDGGATTLSADGDRITSAEGK